MTANSPRRGYTLRLASSVVLFWIGTGVLAFVVGAAVVIGDWTTFAFVTPPALLLAWVLWLVLYRPAVHYDDARATVVNPGRIHVLPWARVSEVVQRASLVFELDDGRRITAWAVPYPRRSGVVARNLDFRRKPEYDFDSNARPLRGFLDGRAQGTEPVVSRWDVVPLLIGLVLLIVAVVAIVLLSVQGAEPRTSVA